MAEPYQAAIPMRAIGEPVELLYSKTGRIIPPAEEAEGKNPIFYRPPHLEGNDLW